MTSSQRAPDREDDSSGAFTVATALCGAALLAARNVGRMSLVRLGEVCVGGRQAGNSSPANTKRSDSRII